MHKSLLAAALLIAAPLAAQPMPESHHKMAGMEHGRMAMGDMAMMKNTPANPYAEAAMEMHHKMMVTGADASETWIRQMIEHHRGAIAMSKIAVAKADDKETREMAQKSIAMQEKDVAELESWLKRQGKKPQ